MLVSVLILCRERRWSLRRVPSAGTGGILLEKGVGGWGVGMAMVGHSPHKAANKQISSRKRKKKKNRGRCQRRVFQGLSGSFRVLLEGRVHTASGKVLFIPEKKKKKRKERIHISPRLMLDPTPRLAIDIV